MKERPIIFNSDEVRAILEGRKTMMRRVIKLQFAELVEAHDTGIAFVARGKNKWPVLAPESYVACPYGRPGDRLWVKETWRLPYGAPNRWVDYKADDARDGFKWRSPVHMPRWASRITLEIVSIHVERIQDIGWEDCVKEGVEEEIDYMQTEDGEMPVVDAEATVDEFRRLWGARNSKCGYGWYADPWVWVIEFKREGATR